jgi:uncharacterized membrane protein YdjX (TVP38/TMEM64 family)
VSSGPPGGGTWTAVAVTLASIAIGLAIAMAVPPLREALGDALQGDTEAVRADLRDLGGWGVALVFWMALIHAVVFYPSEILNAAAGFVYGFGPALAMMIVAWFASGILAYWIGRHAARPLLYRLAGKRRFERLEQLIHRGGVTILLAARLVPIVPFSLTGYVCGAARVPFVRYAWTTGVGYIPITAYFVYLGSRVEDLSLADPVLWIGGAALVLAILGVRFLLPAAQPDRRAEPAEPLGRVRPAEAGELERR